MQKHLHHGSLPLLRHGLVRLDLDFLSGFGETVHPDVIFVPAGWRHEDWRYLMTLTPLPHGAEYFENPEFVVSRDGIHWQLPMNGRSPVVSPPDVWLGFNSDPSLVLEGSVLYLFYRDIREYNENDVEVRVLLTSTSDGIKWASPAVIISLHHSRKYPALLMSPSILKIGDCYYMWYVSGDGCDFSVFRRKSKDLLIWGQPEKTLVNGLRESEWPWHLDIVQNGAELIAVLCTSHKNNFRRKSIYFATSCNGGITWIVKNMHLSPGDYGFGEASLYRGALVNDASQGAWKLYYSGQDDQKHWYTVLMDLDMDSLEVNK